MEKEVGLTDPVVQERLEKYGKNRLPDEKTESALVIFIRQFTGPLIPVLLLAFVITIFLHEYIDSVVIVLTIALTVCLSFIQEYKAQDAITKLKQMTTPLGVVLRNGTKNQVKSEDIVPGDIMLLEEGMKITADGRIIESNDLKIDESVLTGESQPVTKNTDTIREEVIVNDQVNMVFAGTSVIRGDGRALVVGTGSKTQIGQIAQDVTSIEKGKTPLQESLDRLGRWLVVLVIAVCGGIFGIGVLTGKELGEMFLFTVSLAVSVLPEGLVVSVTIALAVGMTVMAKRKAILRTLGAVETLGAVSVIAADKTGTLTMNKLSVQQVFTNNQRHLPKQLNFLDEEKDKRFIEIATLANNADIGGELPVGDPLEIALLNFARDNKINYPIIQERCPRLGELPFATEYRMMASLNGSTIGEGSHLYVKGSPNEVLEKCQFELIENRVLQLSDNVREHLLDETRQMASEGLKPLVFAYRDSAHTGAREIRLEDIPNDLVFVAIVGFADALRPEAVEAVAQVQQAGIRVLMLTGDHRLTATAIAKQVGIQNAEEVIKGVEVDRLNDDELANLLKEKNVFARVTPRHKLKIVRLLQGMGEIVAMTGDGVNDAPALANADIGVAMGEGGTDVAKGASDMVILDNNFNTIKAAVEEGRGIYANLKRVIMYLLSTNVGEVLLMIFALLMGSPLPLYPTQILWLNLVTDGLPDVALIFEPTEKDVLKQPPRNTAEFILNHRDIVRIVLYGSVMAVLSYIVFIYYQGQYGLEYARTATLVFMAFLQLVNVYNIQAGDKSIFRSSLTDNRILTYAVIISAILQIAVVSVPFLQRLFRTVPLRPIDWLILIGSALSIVVVNELWFLLIKMTKSEDSTQDFVSARS